MKSKKEIITLLLIVLLTRAVIAQHPVAFFNQHQYDLPFQYQGQIMKTSFIYKAFTNSKEPFGKANGYQFYWKEAEATIKDSLARFSILNGKSFYTISSLTDDSTKIFFVWSGANDPQFNLRHEPACIIRKKCTMPILSM